MTALAWVWGLIWLAAASMALWPRVTRWQPASEPRLIHWPLTVGLSFGALTLWMLFVGFWPLNVWIVLAFPAILLLAQFFLPRGAKSSVTSAKKSVAKDLPNPPEEPKKYLSMNSVLSLANSLRQGDGTAWITLVGISTLIIVLAQATYYPFTGEDEISRYAYYARLIVFEGQVTPDVRGYPMLLPMLYAFVFFATGQLPEQLARLVPVLYSAATVLATGALAWRWVGRRGAWAAMLALIATPLYVRWSPEGYIDIPSALYFVLSAYAADVWLAGRNPREAVLAGVLAGLALWTKQAGFAALGTLGVVFAWAIARDLFDRQSLRAVTAIRDGLLTLLAATLVGGVWYFRNAYYDGWANAVPGPGQFYYQLADHSLTQLVPFIGEFWAFGSIGSLFYLAGLIWGAIRLKRVIWPVLWAVPYTVLWWWLFSYDPRFLLTVLPFYAILFGGLIAEVRWPTTALGQWIVVAAIATAATTSLFASQLGGWRQWLVAPTATYAERLIRAKGDLYPTVEFIRDQIPVEARIISMDGRLRYYLIDRPITVTYPFTMAEVWQHDYFVVGSWWPDAYAGFGLADSDVGRALGDPEQLAQIYSGPAGTLTVYRILKP